MRAGDLAAVVELERGCVEAPQWGAAVWERLLNEDGGELRCVMVAEVAGRVAGYVVTGGVAGVAEIETIAVEPGQRGRGVGRALCKEAMRRVSEPGAKTMQLEVRESNVAARGMYAALGFIEQGVRRGYYKSPVEDGVLMSAVLTGREL